MSELTLRGPQPKPLRFRSRQTLARQYWHYNESGAPRTFAGAQGSMPSRTYGWLPVAAVTALLCWPPSSAAQTVISARAGLLNYTDGCVLLEGKHIEFKQSRVIHLLPKQQLRTENGNAEVMLGPAIFLRLGFESEAEMVSTDLTAPQVRLRSGSALIDANGLSSQSPVSVLVDGIELRLVKKGLYRVDMPPQGPHTVSVLDGEAVLVAGSRKSTVVERHEVELSDGLKNLSARKAERPNNDPLDQWSSERASAIAQLNGELLRKVVEEDRNEKGFRWPGWGLWRR